MARHSGAGFHFVFSLIINTNRNASITGGLCNRDYVVFLTLSGVGVMIGRHGCDGRLLDMSCHVMS